MNVLTDVAGLSITLDAVGFEEFETACDLEEATARERLVSQPGVEEAYVVRTCQRYELYARGPRAAPAVRDVTRSVTPRANSVLESSAPEPRTGEAAVIHLFRVACGLESGVLGEDEILGQLREGYKRASDAGHLGSALDTIVLKALRVGERARTETAINEGTVSLGSVTVGRAVEAVEDFSMATVLVLGAGEVAELVVKALSHRDEIVGSILIANRTIDRAAGLAAEIDGRPLPLEDVPSHLSAVDVVVAATGSPDRVLTREDLAGHDLAVFDLANPRDIDPAVDELPGIDLVGLEELFAVRNDGLERRRAAVSAVEALIEEERTRLCKQLRAERVDDSLGRIYADAHALRKTELEEALDRLEAIDEGLTETQEETIRTFSEALINKLLHPKTTALRQAAANDDRGTVDAWLELLGNGGNESERESAEETWTVRRKT